MTFLERGGGRSGDPDLKFINKEKSVPDRRFFPLPLTTKKPVIPNEVRNLPL
jgi:hypothetical protein